MLFEIDIMVVYRLKEGGNFLGEHLPNNIPDNHKHCSWLFCPNCGEYSKTAVKDQNLSDYKRFAQIFSHSTSNMFIIDNQANFIYYNAAMLDLLGYTNKEIDKTSLFDVVHSDDLEVVRQTIHEISSQQSKVISLEIRLVSDNNIILWNKIDFIAIYDESEQINILGICVDISKQKTAEIEINNQNTIISLLYDTSLAIIKRLDVNKLLLTILKRAASLVGTPHGYIYHYHPDTDTMEMEIGIGMYADKRVVNLKSDQGGVGGIVWRTGQPVVIDDYSDWPGRLPDLPFYPRSVIAVPLKSGDGVISIITLASLEKGRVFNQKEVVRLLQFGQLASIALNNAMLFSELKQEIADRKKAEEALYESTQQLRAIMESAKDFIYIKDNKSVFREANPAMYRFLGLDREDILGKTMKELFDEESASHTFILDKQVLSGEAVEEELTVETQDSEYIFDKLEWPLRDQDDNIIGISGIMRDITERKKAEREMLEAREIVARSEKLASLGVMAAGISHEINQPLNSIKVTATGLLYRYKKGMSLSIEDIMDEVDDISLQVDRIDNIVKHMRAIIRDKDSTKLSPCNLNEIVEHALELVGSQINAHGVILHKHLADDLPLILGTETGLEEVVINLVINAIQALEGSAHTHKEISIASKAENDVILEIKDNGPGISNEIKGKVFDPFFTTKENQRNMGVGLSITQSIVAVCQGNIYIYSNDKQGTSFVLRFPKYT